MLVYISILYCNRKGDVFNLGLAKLASFERILPEVSELESLGHDETSANWEVFRRLWNLHFNLVT
jgi:hypothetical protein